MKVAYNQHVYENTNISCSQLAMVSLACLGQLANIYLTGNQLNLTNNGCGVAARNSAQRGVCQWQSIARVSDCVQPALGLLI